MTDKYKAQRDYYHRQKEEGTIKKRLAIDEDLLLRFQSFRDDNKLTNDEAFNRMLKKVKY